MRRTHIRALTDDQLRPQLEAGDIIFFLGPQFRLQEIERQVERLGFAEGYIVSATRGPNSDRAKIRVKPDPRRWPSVPSRSVPLASFPNTDNGSIFVTRDGNSNSLRCSRL